MWLIDFNLLLYTIFGPNKRSNCIIFLYCCCIFHDAFQNKIEEMKNFIKILTTNKDNNVWYILVRMLFIEFFFSLQKWRENVSSIWLQSLVSENKKIYICFYFVINIWMKLTKRKLFVASKKPVVCCMLWDGIILIAYDSENT